MQHGVVLLEAALPLRRLQLFFQLHLRFFLALNAKILFVFCFLFELALCVFVELVDHLAALLEMVYWLPGVQNGSTVTIFPLNEVLILVG